MLAKRLAFATFAAGVLVYKCFCKKVPIQSRDVDFLGWPALDVQLNCQYLVLVGFYWTLCFGFVQDSILVDWFEWFCAVSTFGIP